MKPFIVLIPVNSLCNPRKACEQLENTMFKTGEYHVPSAQEILKKVVIELELEANHNIEVEPITDFMDRVNNEAFNPDHYFMSYVFAN